MAKDFVDLVIQHEGVKGNQTPFRITDPKMGKWTSMFDDTIRTKLDPGAKKAPGTENFLYTQDPKDVKPAVHEQFRRYDERTPGITVEDAVRIFDQSGAAGKLKFLQQNGIDPKSKIKDHVLNREQEELGSEMVRQLI